MIPTELPTTLPAVLPSELPVGDTSASPPQGYELATFTFGGLPDSGDTVTITLSGLGTTVFEFINFDTGGSPTPGFYQVGFDGIYGMSALADAFYMVLADSYVGYGYAAAEDTTAYLWCSLEDIDPPASIISATTTSSAIAITLE